MVEIAITKLINADLLVEQLDAAYGLINPDFWLVAREGGQVVIRVPEGLDPALAEAVLAVHDAAKETERNRLKVQIVSLAQSAVGVRLQDLTAAQVRALVACMMYKAGAIDAETLTIRPLSEWV